MIAFFITSFLLGVGLAMDAFSVSVANAMRDPNMKKSEMTRIAGAFACFQFLMPEIGFLCVHTLLTYFESFQIYIPWIALILLAYIGGKMLMEGIRDRKDMHGTGNGTKNTPDSCGKDGEAYVLQGKENRDRVRTARVSAEVGKDFGVKALPTHTLILQAIATSIDALSVGFAIAEYTVAEALISGVIIAVVTFCICIGGLLIGKKTGDLLGWRASIFGGLILIGIGIEIWAGGLF